MENKTALSHISLTTLDEFKNQKPGTMLVLDSSNLPDILQILKDKGYESAGRYQRNLPKDA